MSYQPPDTTRIGGGSSARLAAAAAAVALAAVVGVAIMGRLPTEPAPTQAPGVRIASTVSPTPAASPTPSPSPTRRPARSPTPAAPPPPLQDEALAIIIHGTDRPRGYLAILHETSPGLLTADIRVASGGSAAGGTAQLAQLWTREEGPPFALIDTFELPADALSAENAGEAVIEATAAPRPDAQTAPRVVRRGYRLRVRTEWRNEQPFFVIKLAVGGPTPWRVDSNWFMSHPEAAEWGVTR